MHKSYDHVGLPEALKAVFDYLNATAKFVEPAGTRQSGEVLACFISQDALVATN